MTALMSTVTGHGSFLLRKTKTSHSNHAINVPNAQLQNHKRYRHGGTTSMQMDFGQMTSEQMSLRTKETTWSVYVKGPFTNGFVSCLTSLWQQLQTPPPPFPPPALTTTCQNTRTARTMNSLLWKCQVHKPSRDSCLQSWLQHHALPMNNFNSSKKLAVPVYCGHNVTCQPPLNVNLMLSMTQTCLWIIPNT